MAVWSGANAPPEAGEAIAYRKLRKLVPYGPALTVICPSPCAEMAAAEGIRLERRAFCAGDVTEELAFVIAATDDRALNRHIAALCRAKRVPVNSVDDAKACSFLFPSLLLRGRLSAGICTGGASPTAAAALRRQLEEMLPENMEEILDWLERQRPTVKAAEPQETRRAALFRALYLACMEKGRPLTPEKANGILKGGENA